MLLLETGTTVSQQTSCPKEIPSNYSSWNCLLELLPTILYSQERNLSHKLSIHQTDKYPIRGGQEPRGEWPLTEFQGF